MDNTTNDIKLTQYSHGAGCGCKIAPAVLEQILKGQTTAIHDAKLLVGNASKDDAAVYDLGNGTAPVSYTHLDVYKRQVQPLPECIARLGNFYNQIY